MENQSVVLHVRKLEIGRQIGHESSEASLQVTPRYGLSDCRYSVYLLYWCKSTNTDAAAADPRECMESLPTTYFHRRVVPRFVRFWNSYVRRRKAHARVARHIRNSWSRMSICDALEDWVDAYNHAGVRSSSGEEEDEEAWMQMEGIDEEEKQAGAVSL